MASMPVSAVMALGMVAVTSGSRMAMSGIISMLPMPCLMPPSVMTTERETSLAERTWRGCSTASLCPAVWGGVWRSTA
jgi:hypothetical protein